VHGGFWARSYTTKKTFVDAVAVGDLPIVTEKLKYRINSDIRDTSVSAIALVFSFFQYARPLLFCALHIMIGQLLKKTKKTALSPKTEVSLISELIRYGTYKDAMTENGFAALHLAAQNGHEKTVKVLLDSGANTEAKTKKDRTALHLAAQNVHGKVVRVLLDSGASNEGRDSSRWMGVRWAVEKDKAELLKLIE
jgi:ankyrin repeat protein